MNITKHKRYLIFLLLLIWFLLMFSGALSRGVIGGDAMSIFYPVKKLLLTHQINFWDALNFDYQTYYFKMNFTDTVIKSYGEEYPMQPISIIIYVATYVAFFGEAIYPYINLCLSVGIVLLIYGILKNLQLSREQSILGIIPIMTLPVFIYRAVSIQNIIPATFFLIGSIYFLLLYDTKHKINYVYIALFFLCSAVYMRIVFVLWGFVFLPYIYGLFAEKKKNAWAHLIGLVCIGAVFLGGLLLQNVKYFQAADFIGYFHTHYHPQPLGYEDETIMSSPQDSSYLALQSTNLVQRLSSLYFFFLGSFRAFGPLLVLFVGIMILSLLQRRKQGISKFTLGIYAAIILNVLYIATIENTLWFDERNQYTLSLSLAYFRYLLPVYLLGYVVVMHWIVRRMTGKVPYLLLGFFLLTNYAFFLYRYSGGANLTYVQEFRDKQNEFNALMTQKVPTGSVILYDTRRVQHYLFPNLFEYHWFCYDCIPPSSRAQHTLEVVNGLLDDGHEVFFASFGEPYNQLSKGMEELLFTNFILRAVEGTYFEREKFILYRVSNKTGK